MNWRIEKTVKAGKPLGKVDVATVGEGTPSGPLVAAGKKAAGSVAKALGTDALVTIEGHESEGEGFQPGHVSITVSRVDPKVIQ